MGFELEIQQPGRFKKPTVELVKMYCEQHSYQIDAEAFWDYFESVGWMVGKKKMKDWQAAVRTWWRRQLESGKSTRPQPRLHQAKSDRKLTQEQRQNGRQQANILRKAIKSS